MMFHSYSVSLHRTLIQCNSVLFDAVQPTILLMIIIHARMPRWVFDVASRRMVDVGARIKSVMVPS